MAGSSRPTYVFVYATVIIITVVIGLLFTWGGSAFIAYAYAQFSPTAPTSTVNTLERYLIVQTKDGSEVIENAWLVEIPTDHTQTQLITIMIVPHSELSNAPNQVEFARIHQTNHAHTVNFKRQEFNGFVERINKEGLLIDGKFYKGEEIWKYLSQANSNTEALKRQTAITQAVMKMLKTNSTVSIKELGYDSSFVIQLRASYLKPPFNNYQIVEYDKQKFTIATPLASPVK